MPPDGATAEPRHRLDTWRRRSVRRWDVDPRTPEPNDDLDGLPEIVRAAAAAGLEDELAALASELAVAGARARARALRDVAAGPDPAFAAALRGRLVAQLPSRAAVSTASVTMASARATPARATAVPRAFDRLGAPRWTALAVVAMLAFVAIARDAGPATRVPPQAHVTTAGAASIIGVGASRAAAAGAALLAGDVLVVDPGGRAAVAIGGAELRLAGGAAIELERLGAGEAVLVQMAGRAWFRADTSGPSLIVRSGGMTWTASDATFDVVRGVAAGGARGGADVVLVVRGSIAFHAADLDGSISQGRRATVTDTGNLPDTRFTTAAPGDLADPWLAENAALDRDQGRPVGILAGVPAGKAVVTIP